MAWLRRHWRGLSAFLLSSVPGVIFLSWASSNLPNPFADHEVSLPPPAEEQIADDMPSGSTPKKVLRVHLRNAASPSYLVIVRHPPPKAGSRPWDEVRIYDTAGSSVERAFSARPLSLLGGAPTVQYAGIRWGNREGRMYQFRLLGMQDANGDGRSEAYGVFRDQVSSVERPVAIAWDQEGAAYRLSALVPSPVRAPVYSDGRIDVAHWAQREARTPLRVAAWPDEEEISVYGSTRSVIRSLRGIGLVLVNGHAADDRPVLVTRSAGGHRHQGPGVSLTHRQAYGRAPQISLLTIEVARLRVSQGKVEPLPCPIYATSRIRPDLAVPKLAVSALARHPLAPQRLTLGKRLVCGNGL